MALWDSAYLLARCKALARRPATDQAASDPNWYEWLSFAQPEVAEDLYTRAPDLQYSAPLLLTSSDGGKTYGWGNDDAGDPIRPTGHTEIYPNLKSIPDYPLIPGLDFIFEGAKIRMPADRSRTFSAGPYSRFVARPDREITALIAPVIQPKTARRLLVIKAVELFASRPGSGMRPSYYEAMYDKQLDKVLIDLRSAYNMAGGQPSAGAERVWWFSGDLAD